MGDLSKHFSRSEFKCACCDYDTVDAKLLEILEAIREHFDRPVRITSGARCWNRHSEIYRELGQEPTKNSQHLFGRAADIVVDGVPPIVVQELCEDIGVPGLGKYDDFTHIDTRSGRKARW